MCSEGSEQTRNGSNFEFAIQDMRKRYYSCYHDSSPTSGPSSGERGLSPAGLDLHVSLLDSFPASALYSGCGCRSCAPPLGRGRRLYPRKSHAASQSLHGLRLAPSVFPGGLVAPPATLGPQSCCVYVPDPRFKLLSFRPAPARCYRVWTSPRGSTAATP